MVQRIGVRKAIEKAPSDAIRQPKEVAEGKLYVHATHTEFIDQYNAYPAVSHDDVIETVSMACDEAMHDGVLEGDYRVLEQMDADLEDLDFGGCP